MITVEQEKFIEEKSDEYKDEFIYEAKEIMRLAFEEANAKLEKTKFVFLKCLEEQTSKQEEIKSENEKLRAQNTSARVAIEGIDSITVCVTDIGMKPAKAMIETIQKRARAWLEENKE